jgi:quercetin dioxygenase-like cupin family protein
MPKTHAWSLNARELAPGYRAHLIHTEHTTHSYVDIDPEMPLPAHSHPHEQIVNVLEGTLELVVDGTPHLLNAGDVFVIPGGTPHGCVAHTPCRVLDVFSPVREEYR